MLIYSFNLNIIALQNNVLYHCKVLILLIQIVLKCHLNEMYT